MHLSTAPGAPGRARSAKAGSGRQSQDALDIEYLEDPDYTAHSTRRVEFFTAGLNMTTPSDKTHLRSSPRFLVKSKCDIFYNEKLYKALVQDLSDGGMLLLRNLDFEVGTIFGVHLNLSTAVSVDCEVETRNCSEMGVGVKIDYMDDQNRKLYQDHLQDFLSHQLNKLG